MFRGAGAGATAASSAGATSGRSVGNASRAVGRRGPDTRLMVGLLLMAASVVGGYFVVASAGARTEVWTTARVIEAGAEIRAEDVVLAKVGLDSAQAAAYAGDPTAPPVGRATIAMASGALIPVNAVGGEPKEIRLVSVPVDAARLSADIERGARVDVWLTEGEPSVGGASRQVLPRVLVADVMSAAESVTDQRTVVLEVSVPQAAALVAASRQGALDLVGVGGQQ